MSEGEVYTIRLPKRLVAEVLRRGFDVELIVVEALLEKLNLDPSEEIATRIEIAEHFLEEAKKHVERGDAVQASENLYKVAEECIKALAVKFKVQVVESLRATRRYCIVYEEDIRNYVIEIALSTSSSGFDTYFIATAKLYNATLITDDEPMSIQAERVGVNTILVRKISTEELIAKINELVGMTR